MTPEVYGSWFQAVCRICVSTLKQAQYLSDNMEIKATHDSIYRQLPDSAQIDCKDVGIKKTNKVEDNFVWSFLQKNIPANRAVNLVEDLKNKVYFLDNVSTTKRKYDKTPKKRKTLTAKERKKLGLFKLPPENQSYVLYEPLHQLWQDYMKDLINFERITNTNQKDLQIKLTKADYHGAVITVTKSRCPSFVGTTGILVQETKNTFRIITKQDKLKTIPKQNSIFSTHIEGYMLTIYGNHFQVKSSERTHKKFKTKATIDL